MGKKSKSGKRMDESQVEGQEIQSAESAADGASVEEVADNQLTQREGVYQEVMRVVRECSINYDPAQPIKPVLSEDALKSVYAGLANRFVSGEIPLKATESNQKKLADPKLLETYIIGLVNNWLRRDKRLNGKDQASV